MALHALEGAPFVENRPGDTGELIGERNRQHVMVQPLVCCLDPGFEPVALPILWPNPGQHDPGCLNGLTCPSHSNILATVGGKEV